MNVTSEYEFERRFAALCVQRVQEACSLWKAYADLRRVQMAPHGTAGLPMLRGRIESTTVTIRAVGSPQLGYRTLATAEAKLALRGKLRLSPRGVGVWDDFTALLRRRFFDDPELERLLVVRASSRSFARTLLDERVLESVRALAPEQLRLTYVGGAISVEWGGVERNFAVLDDVTDLLSYLAVQGSETAPYR